MMDRALKDTLYEQFARIGKALDSPKRIELLELLAQGERSVEALAALTDMGMTNTSAHLQVLRSARLATTRKHGTRVFYRLSDEQVARLVAELRALAHARLAEVEQAVQAYLHAKDDPEPVTRAELLQRLDCGEVMVLDVRPAEEYAAGHIPGARSIPLEHLEAELARLPHDTEVVAYCRGPYCLLAPTAVRLLRQHGYRARQLEDGLPEWRLAGLPVTAAS
jgi:rhodanese-related sulfurtransferase/DNA-binding transcriptional ArsR family regulator